MPFSGRRKVTFGAPNRVLMHRGWAVAPDEILGFCKRSTHMRVCATDDVIDTPRLAGKSLFTREGDKEKKRTQLVGTMI